MCMINMHSKSATANKTIETFWTYSKKRWASLIESKNSTPTSITKAENWIS